MAWFFKKICQHFSTCPNMMLNLLSAFHSIPLLDITIGIRPRHIIENLEYFVIISNRLLKKKIIFKTIIKFTSNISNCTTNLWFTWFSYIAVTFQSTSVTEIPIRAWERAIMSKWSYASWKMLKEKLNIDVLMNVTCNIIET